MAQFTNTHKTQVVDQVTDKWTEQNEIARVEIRLNQQQRRRWSSTALKNLYMFILS